jgi:hypothetical protein
MTTPTPCSATWRRRVAAYHDGGLVSTERNAIEAHIRTCATCQALITSYDQVYRALRAMPGFEGVLTITRPGTRRGVGSSQRPSFTYPGRSYTGPEGRRGMRSAGGGAVVVTLLLVLAVVFLAGRNNGFFGPSSQSVTSTNPTAVPAPTFGITVPGGAPCANQRATAQQPYVYTDVTKTVWEVVGCNQPTRLTTLPVADSELGAWSPDDSKVLAFAPALPQRTATTITHLYLLGYNQAPQLLDLRLSANGPALTADDAIWVNTTSLIVRSHTTVLHVDLTTNIVTALPFTATQIEWRANMLFYSTIQAGQAILYRYDPATKITTKMLSLGVGMDTCQVWTCWSNAAWDVSQDGLSVAHQSPLPKHVPTSQITNTGLVLQDLGTGAESAAGSMPFSNAPIALHISPDSHFIAAINMDANATTISTVVDNFIGLQTLTFAQAGRLEWRPDSAALIIMPFSATSTTQPMEALVLADITTQLQTGTGNYDWQV